LKEKGDVGGWLWMWILVKKTPTPTQSKDMNFERILFIFLSLHFFTVSVYILFYTALMKSDPRTIPVSNISPAVFKQLYREHAETLSCPCSTIKMPLKAFVSNTIKFHPVCSSNFVSQKWIRALYLEDASRYGTGDFRTTASSQVSPSFFFKASYYPSNISSSRIYYIMNSKNHLLFDVYSGILLVSNKELIILI